VQAVRFEYNTGAKTVAPDAALSSIAGGCWATAAPPPRSLSFPALMRDTAASTDTEPNHNTPAATAYFVSQTGKYGRTVFSLFLWTSLQQPSQLNFHPLNV